MISIIFSFAYSRGFPTVLNELSASSNLKKKILEECVEEVLQILADKKER